MKKEIVKSTSNSGSQTATTPTSPSTAKTAKANQQLSVQEKAILDKCTVTIKRGLSSYIEIGAAFKEIKDKELHRELKLPFDKYCEKAFGTSKVSVNRLIAASECAKRIEIL